MKLKEKLDIIVFSVWGRIFVDYHASVPITLPNGESFIEKSEQKTLNLQRRWSFELMKNISFIK